MTHLDEPTLLRSIDGEVLEPSLAAHLATCVHCQEERSSVEAVIQQLRDPASWAPVPSQETEAIGAALHAFADGLERETAAAAILVAHESPSALRERVAAGTLPPTPGLVKVLIAAAEERRTTAPPTALAYADLASYAAGMVHLEGRLGSVGPHLVGLAAKERANVLRVLGRFHDALRAVREAEHALRPLVGAEYDRASVAFVHATILSAIEHYDEARRLTQEAATIFHDFHDPRKESHARMLDAYCASLQGNPREARAILEKTLALVDGTDDAETHSALLLNLGNSAAEVQDWPAATDYLERAAVLAEAHGLPIDAARVRWSFASVLASAGRLDLAIARLREVRQAFLNLGLPIETAVSSLELADLLLADNQPREAHAVCAGLAAEFLRLQMPSPARAAIAYLAEASELSRDKIDRVKLYLERFEREPTLRFHP